MNQGKYVFRQLVEFLPKRVFDWIVMKYEGDKYIKSFSCWNQLLIVMYGQLSGCENLRELVCVMTAHSQKSYHFGFGRSSIKRSNLAKENANRDCKIFEEFTNKMTSIAQGKQITREFVIAGRFYDFDSTTIDQCLNLYWWASFRKSKSEIKAHTLYVVVVQIPTLLHITHARVNVMNAMDEIPCEPNAYYIFERGYFDLARNFLVNLFFFHFVIRQRSHLEYVILKGEDFLEGPDIILFDPTIILTGRQTGKKHPNLLRRIVNYSTEHNRSLTYLTNSFEVKTEYIALHYKNRWQVELFFQWIKQQLHVKSFWGNTKNAVRIKIFSAITTYCLFAIIEHDLHLNRSTFNVLHILSMSLFDKTPFIELYERTEIVKRMTDNGQPQLCFNFYWTLMIPNINLKLFYYEKAIFFILFYIDGSIVFNLCSS